MAKDCLSSWFRYFHLFHSIWMRRYVFSDLKHCWPQICREGANHIQMKICNCDILRNLGNVSFCLRFGWVGGFGVWFFGFSSSLSPVNNLSDLCWAKNRTLKHISQKNQQLHAPPERYIFVCSSIPKVSFTSVASLTTGITELERVLLWNVNVVYFLCSSFQHFGLNFQILVCGNHKSWGIDT